MAVVKLTKRKIGSLKTDKKSGVRYFDSELKGFGIVVRPNNSMTFFINYGPETKRKFMAIGRYGHLTLEQAREIAHEKLYKISKGVDPREEKKAKKNRMTFREWADYYLKNVVQKKKSVREDRRYLGLMCKKFEEKFLTEIEVEDIEPVFNEFLMNGKDTTANRWLASIRACLEKAFSRGKINVNPAKRIHPTSEPAPRLRTMNDEEWFRFITAIEEIPDIYAQAAFKILAGTGARLSEVLNATWEEIDLENQIWTILRPKSGKPEKLPFSPDTIELLRKVPRLGKYVIVGKNPDKPRADLKRSWKQIQKLANLNDVHIHDIRRSFGLQVSLQFGIHIASKLLRHSDIRVTERHYSPLSLNLLKEALENREKSLRKKQKAQKDKKLSTN